MDKIRTFFKKLTEKADMNGTTDTKTGTPTTPAVPEPSLPVQHPSVDWSKWEPAGEGDFRSPCPMINALSNHHILPHDGRGITKELAVSALMKAINLDHFVANTFTTGALATNPDNHLFTASESPATFDLHQVGRHNLVEHDCSLSRPDQGLGDSFKFSDELWSQYLKFHEGKTHTDFQTQSRARFARVAASEAAHKAGENEGFQYGIKEMVFSYGESALLVGVLGDPKEGKVPLEWVKVLFEEERIPYIEGWRPYSRAITQMDLNHLIFRLIEANEHKMEETKLVGLGTMAEVLHAVERIHPKSAL